MEQFIAKADKYIVQVENITERKNTTDKKLNDKLESF